MRNGIPSQQILEMQSNAPKEFQRLWIVHHRHCSFSFSSFQTTLLDGDTQFRIRHRQTFRRRILVFELPLEKFLQRTSDGTIDATGGGRNGVGRVRKGLKTHQLQKVVRGTCRLKEGVVNVCHVRLFKFRLLGALIYTYTWEWMISWSIVCKWESEYMVDTSREKRTATTRKGQRETACKV